jgi:hypothetical protein
MLDQIRREIHDLEDLLGESDKLRRALAALSTRGEPGRRQPRNGRGQFGR